MSSLNHGRYKMHRESIGTREQPAVHRADLLAYAKRPRANINPHTGITHFVQSARYYGNGRLSGGRVRVYRMARAQHLQSTCGLGCWPFLMAGPIGFLP